MERRKDDHIFVTLLGRDEVKPSGTKQSESQGSQEKRHQRGGEGMADRGSQEACGRKWYGEDLEKQDFSKWKNVAGCCRSSKEKKVQEENILRQSTDILEGV